MGQWVRCTLESDEKQGEQKLVRHLNLDYYVRMERNPNNTTLLRGVGAGEMIVIETSAFSRIKRANSLLSELASSSSSTPAGKPRCRCLDIP